MVRTRSLVICYALLLVTAGSAEGGLMIGISGLAGSQELTVTLGGSDTTPDGFLAVTELVFDRDPAVSQTESFSLEGGFGLLTASSGDSAVIREIRVAGNEVTVFTETSFAAAANATIAFPSINANSSVPNPNDILSLIPGGYSLTSTSPTGAGLSGNLTVTQLVGSNPVPEPSSLAIFGIGAIGMLGLGSRRRKEKSPTPN